MRPDMSRVLTECYRRGSDCPNPDVGRNRRRHQRPRSLDDLPRRERMLPHHEKFINRREFSDHITPLFRWLRSCVGRPWNDVYSEACANLNRNSTTQRHVFGHLLDHVSLRTEIRDGQLGELNRWGGFWPFRKESLYVDNDGILRRFLPPKSPPKKSAFADFSRKKGRFFGKINGTWHELFFAPYPEHFQDEFGKWHFPSFEDKVFGRFSQGPYGGLGYPSPPWSRIFEKPKMYCNETTPLTSTKLRHFGLKND